MTGSPDLVVVFRDTDPRRLMRIARTIQAVDAHACGEHGRVITGGVLDVPGRTMFDKMTYLRTHADGLRKLMLREPRGYPAANCNLILPRPGRMRMRAL